MAQERLSRLQKQILVTASRYDWCLRVWLRREINVSCASMSRSLNTLRIRGYLDLIGHVTHSSVSRYRKRMKEEWGAEVPPGLPIGYHEKGERSRDDIGVYAKGLRLTGKGRQKAGELKVNNASGCEVNG